jgi:hypothetical protein
MPSIAFVPLAVGTAVVVIAVAAAVVLVVLFVTLSMRGRQSVAQSGAARLATTRMKPRSEPCDGATATVRRRAERTAVQTGRWPVRRSREDDGSMGQAQASG